MSYFDFPRMNFSGTISINVGTVNNDDYSGDTIASGPGNGQLLRLSDSVNVQPITFGLNDDDFIAWSQTPVSVQGSPNKIIPGEWNYYGDMSVTFQDVNIVGVNLLNGTLQTSGNPLIGANLSFNNDAGRTTALIYDINPEDVPSSVIFADVMALRDADGNNLFQGNPSKGDTRWINFFRNASLTASAGASGVFQHVIPIANFSDPGVQSVLRNLGMDVTKLPPGLKGFVVRYSIYKVLPPIRRANYASNDLYNQALIDMYNQPYPDNQNPAISSVSGTIGLWFEGEMKSITMGRYLVPVPALPVNPPAHQANCFSTGNYTNNNGNGYFTLGPAVINLYIQEGRITLDISNTFPEVYQSATANPKLAFAPFNNSTGIMLAFIPAGETNPVTIRNLDYSNTSSYIRQGGLIDFTGISRGAMYAIEKGRLVIAFTPYTGSASILLTESEYMIASDQADVFAEQGQTENLYRSDGPDKIPCTINVYRYGNPITTPVTLTIQEAQTTPNQDDKLTGKKATVIITPQNNNKFPLSLNAAQRGCMLYRIAVNDYPAATQTPMPCNPISDYSYLTLATDFYVNLRVLPTDDFSAYITSEGVAIQSIPWDYLYTNVLRYYNLILPAMGLHVPFDEVVWQNMAAKIYERVAVSNWGSVTYMPRTRDLSKTRMQLIQAWCRQYMPANSTANPQT
jgi:hypothetical protein